MLADVTRRFDHLNENFMFFNTKRNLFKLSWEQLKPTY